MFLASRSNAPQDRIGGGEVSLTECPKRLEVYAAELCSGSAQSTREQAHRPGERDSMDYLSAHHSFVVDLDIW